MTIALCSRPLRVAVFAALAALAGCAGANPPPPAPADPTPEISVPAPAREPSASPSASPVASVERAPDPPAPADSAPPSPPKAAPETTGAIVSRQGAELTVRIAGSPPPAVGGRGVLSRHFEQQLGPLSTSGWLVIADVVVKKVSGEKVVLTIVEEKSTIVLNGQKVDHFKGGTPIKIELYP